MRALRRRRDDLAKIARGEQNRLEHAKIRVIRLSLQRHVRSMSREMDDLGKRIEDLIAATPASRHKSRLIQSTKGIGPKTAAASLAYVPELGDLTKGEAASIVGLAPFARHPGTLRGHRHVSGGRRDAHASLYMAALSALRSNPAFRGFAARLKARGKPAKAVITAIMRKLIVIMNAKLKDGQASNRYGAAT
nr:transposase [Leisingera sp. F5]